MKLLFAFVFFCHILLAPLISCANGYALFPQESISSLELIDTDSDSLTFTLQNKGGEKFIGSMGDFVGQEEAEIVEIGEHYILVESIEIILNQEGTEYEQPTRMRIPLAQMFYGKGVR